MKYVLSIIFNLFSIAIASPHSSDVNHLVTLSFNSGVSRNDRVLYQGYLTTHTALGKFDLGINELIQEIIDAKEEIKEQIIEALGFELESESESNSSSTNALSNSQNLVNSTESELQMPNFAASLAEGNTTAADILGTTLANANNSSSESTTLPTAASNATK